MIKVGSYVKSSFRNIIKERKWMVIRIFEQFDIKGDEEMNDFIQSDISQVDI